MTDAELDATPQGQLVIRAYSVCSDVNVSDADAVDTLARDMDAYLMAYCNADLSNPHTALDLASPVISVFCGVTGTRNADMAVALASRVVARFSAEIAIDAESITEPQFTRDLFAAARRWCGGRPAAGLTGTVQ